MQLRSILFGGLTLSACSGSSSDAVVGGHNSGGGIVDILEGGGAIVTPEGGGTTGGGCTKASDCQAPKVCDPSTNACSAAIACTGHAQCGKGGICEAGTCVQNTPLGICETDDNCLGEGTCSQGHCGCGGQFFSADSIAPNVLIAMDRSNSMTEQIAGDGKSKIEIAKQAIHDLLASTSSSVQWGLKLWPGDNESCSDGPTCGTGHVFVDVGPATTDAINTVLGNANTCTKKTPIGNALGSLAGYAGLQDAGRANYVVLITDGIENCGGDGVAAATALRGQSPEVKTFVIGFSGNKDEVNPVQLKAIAEAGGTALASDPGYYQANDAAGLAAAFQSISGKVLSCSYSLSGVPEDLSLLYIFFDGVEVERKMDHSGGWDFDPSLQQLTFYNDSCLSLQQGLVTDLRIAYGCPDVSTGEGGRSPVGACLEVGAPCATPGECCGGMDCVAGACSPPVPK